MFILRVLCFLIKIERETIWYDQASLDESQNQITFVMSFSKTDSVAKGDSKRHNTPYYASEKGGEPGKVVAASSAYIFPAFNNKAKAQIKRCSWQKLCIVRQTGRQVGDGVSQRQEGGRVYMVRNVDVDMQEWTGRVMLGKKIGKMPGDFTSRQL